MAKLRAASKTVSISEFVYEFREWESHWRRWTMQEYEKLLSDLGEPNLVEMHGGAEKHLVRMRKEAARIKKRFDARFARGRKMTPLQLRKDR